MEQLFDSINSKKVGLKKSKTVKFNPISTNPESKYKLYHDSLFTLKPSEKLINPKLPQIDQTISQNIMAYTNNNTQSNSEGDELDINILNDLYNHNKLIQSTHIANQIANNERQNYSNKFNNPENGRTIKEIYDNITNDGRIELQQNLDDLEAFDDGTEYVLGEKYGETRFDTYSSKL